MQWRIAVVAWICLCLGLSLALPQNIIGGGLYGDVKKAAFNGPGDIISGAKTYWGFICYNKAYTGNMADIWDLSTGSTTETLLTCSANGVINQTINSLSTTCASGCVIKTYYDQSGALNCTSAACDLTQATNSLRHKLVQSCSGSVLCADMSITGSLYTSANNTGFSQPYTISVTAKRTGSFTSLGGLVTMTSANIQSRFEASANTVGLYAGGTAAGTATASDSAWHAIQFVYNDSVADNINVDGTSNSIAAGTIGTGSLSSNPFNLGVNSTLSLLALVGNGISFGVWGIAFSNTQSSNMSSNQHTNCGC